VEFDVEGEEGFCLGTESIRCSGEIWDDVVVDKVRMSWIAFSPVRLAPFGKSEAEVDAEDGPIGHSSVQGKVLFDGCAWDVRDNVSHHFQGEIVAVTRIILEAFEIAKNVNEPGVGESFVGRTVATDVVGACTTVDQRFCDTVAVVTNGCASNRFVKDGAAQGKLLCEHCDGLFCTFLIDDV